MSWTLINLETGFTINIRNPEPGDTQRNERRQAVGETEGGRIFAQDLNITDKFWDASWSGVSRCEKDDLEAFMESVKYRFGPFLLRTTDGGAFVPANRNPATFSGRFRFDQSNIEFRDTVMDAPRRGVGERFEFTLRLRRVPLPTILIQDVVSIADNVVIALNGAILAAAGDSVSMSDGVTEAVLS